MRSVECGIEEQGSIAGAGDRKSTRLNSSHGYISYAVFCLKKKKNRNRLYPRGTTHRFVSTFNTVGMLSPRARSRATCHRCPAQSDGAPFAYREVLGVAELS